MTVEKDIAAYAAAARKHGEASEAGDSVKANKAFRSLDQRWKQIRMSDSDWRPIFFELLSDDSPWVRLWAASHALHVDPESAVPVLQALSKEPGFLGIDAQMTIETWEKGQLGERN